MTSILSNQVLRITAVNTSVQPYGPEDVKEVTMITARIDPDVSSPLNQKDFIIFVPVGTPGIAVDKTIKVSISS